MQPDLPVHPLPRVTSRLSNAHADTRSGLFGAFLGVFLFVFFFPNVTIFFSERTQRTLASRVGANLAGAVEKKWGYRLHKRPE